MRTFSRSDWLAAQEAWAEGDFGPAWSPLRELARNAGYIYPPAGTKHDDRDAGEPSQRAIVWRALEDNPTEVRRIVASSRSWSQVVDRIIGLEARLREDAGYRDRDAEYDRAERPTYTEAVTSIARILDRIEASQ